MRKITSLLLLIVIGSLVIAHPTAGDYPKPHKPPKVLVSTPTTTPTLTPIPTIHSLTPQEFIIGEINAYRRSLGLYAVQTSDITCNFATIRAQEITTDFSHKGYQDRVANHTMPFSYSLSTENLAKTDDYTRVVTLWKNSPGHAENMRADTPFVCVEQVGNYFAYEGMKP